MDQETPDVAQESLSMTPDFFVIPSIVLNDKDLQPLDAIVFGVIYWFEKMKDGYCRASNKTIAKVARSSSSGVSHSLQRLRETGYIHCEYNERNNRIGITTLVQFSKGGISNEQGGVSQTSNILKNNSIKENKTITDTERSDIDRLYTLYLIRHKIDSHALAQADDNTKRSLLDAAKGRYKLTAPRHAKLLARIRDAGPEMVAKAIVNVSKSEWHMGDNPNQKKYNDLADFICRSYEQVEKWANEEDR